MKIIDVLPNGYVTVQFQDENKYTTNTLYMNFKNRCVKNPYDKTVCSVGYLGVGKNIPTTNGDCNRDFSVWRDMICKCYSESMSKYHSAYYGTCTVDLLWHNYQNFAEWYNDNYYEVDERLHLDKDILYPNCTLYSQETCLLVPQRINELFKYRINKRHLPTGIYIYKDGYTAKPLLTYIDTIKTYEAIDDVGFIMRELLDYASMMKTISDKFDKYPRNFLTTHKIACRNYNRLKIQFEEDSFKERIDKQLEFTYKDYKFIYPDTTQDIKDEAVQQNNCVASYIKGVIDGNCHILFMRKKDKLDSSLVTIEVRNNKIVQAKGKFNRDVTLEEQTVIDKWNSVFNFKEECVA